MLTDKYLAGIPEGSRFADSFYKNYFAPGLDAKMPKIVALAQIAEEMGASLAQFAIAWCVANEKVSTVLFGATSVAQIQETLKASAFVNKISPEIKQRVDAIVQFQPTMHAGIHPTVATYIIKYD